MNLPDRAKPLLDRLDEFALCPAMQTFRAEAEACFMPEERSVEPEDRVSFIDYVAFTHRDAQGHTCIGLFLEEHAGSLAPDMREAFERFEGSVFGVFKVEAVVPGSGLRLRHCGGDTTYEVVETSASLTLQRGMGLIARLVPYRGRHELAGDVRMVLPEVVYLTERLVAQHGDEARAWLADPIAQRALLRELERRPEPSKTRLEAEIGAEAVFTELRLPFTVADLQHRFQTVESLLPLLGELSGHAFASKRELDRATEALTSLWNHTPRAELGGLTPTEAHQAAASRGRPELPEHLAMDLMNAAAAQLKPEDYPDKESYRRALAEFQRRWLETPQAELGGVSPGYLMERPLPPLPYDASLPPLDRPAWTPEALSALLGSQDRRRALWALRWIAEHPQHPAPPDLGAAVGRVLDALLSDIELEAAVIPDASRAGVGEDDEDDLTPGSMQLAEALYVLGKLKGHPLALAAAGAIADRRPRLIASHKDSYADTLSALAELDLEGNVPMLLEALQSDDQDAAADAAMALGKARHAPAAGLMLQLMRSPDLYPDVLADAFAALVSMGEGPAVEEACGPLMAAAEDDDEIWRCLRTALDEVGVIRYMQFHFVEEDLCPAGEAGGEAHPASLESFFPEADAGAAWRACEVLPPEGAHQILDSLRRRPTSAAARFLAERTLQAVELARAVNPLFSPLGGAIAAFTRKLLSWSRLSKLPVEALKEVIVLEGGFLLKAIHGHDLAREVEAAAGDPARLLDLCRSDEKWPTPQLLLGAAQKLQVEPLLEIRAAAGRDFGVENNIDRLLAVLDPTRFLPAAAEDLEHDGEDREAVLGLIARSAGDACLRPYLENPPASSSAARSILNGLLGCLGTERARAVLEMTFELLAGSGPRAIDLLRTAMDCASPACAKALVDRLQSEENLFDLRETLDRGWELEEELETAFALFDLEGSPQEVLGALFTQLEELEGREGVLSRAKEQTDLDDEDDSADVEAEAEEAIALDEDDAPRTIRRTEPKVGRNEKCPCGSGKKYKHCCGKMSPGS